MITALCPHCGTAVPVDGLQVVLACWPKITPYTKRDQTTRIEGYVHGLGKHRAER